MSSRTCQSCGGRVPQTARFCMKCGKEVDARVCQNCGTKITQGARFCTNCGKDAISPPPLKEQARVPTVTVKKPLKMRWLYILVIALVVVAAFGVSIPFIKEHQNRTLSPSITAGAFNYKGSYPEPVTMSYTDKSGESHEVSAYPGQVQLFVKPTTPSTEIKGIAEANGGKIISQIPSLGYYLVSVPLGTENTFIVSVNAEDTVDFAVPSSPFQTTFVDLSDMEGPNGELPEVPNLKAKVGDGVYLYILDDYITQFQCGLHGDGMSFVSSQNLSGTGQGINIADIGGTGIIPSDVVAATGITLEDMTFNGKGRAVLNLSMGGKVEDANHNILPEEKYRESQRGSLWTAAEILDALAQSAPETFKQMVLVISSGNGIGGTCNHGVDFAKEIQELHEKFPRVFPKGGGPHMIIVGGTQLNSNAIDQGYDYSTGKGDMVYAPAHQIQVSSSGCTADGTSPATARVSNLIAALLATDPDLTVEEATKAFMDAYAKKGSLPTVEEIKEALTTEDDAITSYIITPTTGAGGSISPSTPVTVNYGANSTFTITPNPGYHVAGVLVDGTSVDAETSYTFNNVVGNHTIVASFAINTYPQDWFYSGTLNMTTTSVYKVEGLELTRKSTISIPFNELRMVRMPDTDIFVGTCETTCSITEDWSVILPPPLPGHSGTISPTSGHLSENCGGVVFAVCQNERLSFASIFTGGDNTPIEWQVTAIDSTIDPPKVDKSTLYVPRPYDTLYALLDVAFGVQDMSKLSMNDLQGFYSLLSQNSQIVTSEPRTSPQHLTFSGSVEMGEGIFKYDIKYAGTLTMEYNTYKD